MGSALRKIANLLWGLYALSVFAVVSLTTTLIVALLPNLDRCHFTALAQGLPCGRLAVPAWGANTVRTETAFLTGLTAEELGVHQFNPYHQLARRAVPNLAASYKAMGYRTLCIHPYPGTFYLRNQVLKQLGFDEFLDIAHFSDADKSGQYISDAAVAGKVNSFKGLKENVIMGRLIPAGTGLKDYGDVSVEMTD